MAKKLTAADMHRLARIGAAAKLAQLEREIAALKRAFPGLTAQPAPSPPAAQAETSPLAVPGRSQARRSRRAPMSAAERKAVSQRMKRYWDARRKAAKGP